MMILELDCGNSLIKWRVLDGRRVQVSAGTAQSPQALSEQLAADGIRAARMVSVRGDAETAELANLLGDRLGIAIQVAAPARELAGVTNGYQEAERLGLDRWLALVAGWQRFRRPVLVIDIGTAITIDYVDASGQHLGGFIAPGLGLMRRSLLSNTSRIRYESLGQRERVLEPGICTRDAVERGCQGMLLAFCAAQVRQAREMLGTDLQVVVTGGDAGLLEGLPEQVALIPDLVFEGLALACPVHLEGECV